MKIDKIEKLLIFLVIIIILLILIVTFMNIKDDKLKNIESDESTYVEFGSKTKQNISKKMKEEKEIFGLIMQDVNLVYSNNITTFSVVIVNKEDRDYIEKDIQIIFVDKTNKIINRVNTKIPTITSKNIVTLNVSVPNDVLEAYDYYII